MYQQNPPRPPKEVLPTMYDLPSEAAEEPGLPDEFHDFQPQLLRETCHPVGYAADQVFIATDLNLYYNLEQPLWYKRPDWFLVLGRAPASSQSELRLSYVIWQEGAVPFLVVELLSPGTEAEDLGQTLREVNTPPTKWQVYEQVLRIPYYVVFDRYHNQLRVFRLVATRYESIELAAEPLQQRYWFAEIQIGLGVWQGQYQGTAGLWLRWYDAAGNWLPTAAEQAKQERQQVEQERQRAEQERQRAEQERQRAEQERQRAEQERQRADRLAARLRELGVDLDAE
jgi:Uma2 family endonuclease